MSLPWTGQSIGCRTILGHHELQGAKGDDAYEPTSQLEAAPSSRHGDAADDDETSEIPSTDQRSYGSPSGTEEPGTGMQYGRTGLKKQYGSM